MLLSAVSVLVVAQSSSEIPEGLMNNPVLCAVTACTAVGIYQSLQTKAVTTYQTVRCLDHFVMKISILTHCKVRGISATPQLTSVMCFGNFVVRLVETLHYKTGGSGFNYRYGPWKF